MTLGDLTRHIGLEFGLDPTTSGSEYLLMVDWANDAVLDLLLAAPVANTPVTLSLSAGVGDYTLAAAVLQVKGIQYVSSSVQTKLELMNLQQILDLREYAVSNDTPRYYAHQADQIYLYPAPAAADSLKLYTVPKPTVMSAAGNDPTTATYGGIPTQYHPALLGYMRWRASLYEGSRMNPEQIDQYKLAYEQEVNKIKKRVRRQAGPQARMRAGYPSGINAQTRNDTYPER